ncbi:MAG: D-glycerate dehydrogenase, partial [Candidatus Eisenbacteria bacterium]
MSNRVFITRPILPKGIALLEGHGIEVTVGQSDGNAPITHPRLLEGIGNADALICHLSERIDREVLETNPTLCGVATYAVGYNNIDVAAATQLGLPVSNTPDVLTEATADLTWALLLAVARRIPAAHRFTVEGRFAIWNPVLFLGDDVGPGGTGRRKVLG